MKNKNSKSNYLFALFFLIVAIISIYYISENMEISADSNNSYYSKNIIPFKVGDNSFQTEKAVDLSQRIIGLNGSLISFDEAIRRGVITAIATESGEVLSKLDLIVEDTSFIIKVLDISASPALYIEGIK